MRGKLGFLAEADCVQLDIRIPLLDAIDNRPPLDCGSATILTDPLVADHFARGHRQCELNDIALLPYAIKHCVPMVHSEINIGAIDAKTRHWFVRRLEAIELPPHDPPRCPAGHPYHERKARAPVGLEGEADFPVPGVAGLLEYLDARAAGLYFDRLAMNRLT